MLDEYLIGDTTRISPEAPVPVVHIEKSYFSPGGAANTAMNIKKIGACDVKVFSVVGDDKTADIIEKELRKNKIETFFVRESKRITPKKTRVIARGQQVIRIDNETVDSANSSSTSKIIKDFLSERFDVVVVSDYAKGNITEELKSIISGNKSICDPKPKNIKIFEGAYIILPNEKEAHEIFQMISEQGNWKLEESAGKILRKMRLKKIVITRGEKGLFFLSEKKSFSVPALAKDVYDVTGAGDTVSAVFALGEGIALEDEKTATLASVAASIKVSHRGTYIPKTQEIIKSLEDLGRKNEIFE